jgi:3-isopropylmalate/(R)-2-methylmalate dehydratase large subunit
VAEGLHEVFQAAGFQWRRAGCSMCLGMNDDKLQGREMSASSSNRNVIGRRGSPTGPTLLMSPAMVAAAAITGAVADVKAIGRAPKDTVTVDVEKQEVRFGDRVIPATVPDGTAEALFDLLTGGR